MNSSSPRQRRKAAPAALPAWSEQLEEWRKLLGECRLKPTRKRVHFLRVATLRLQAQVAQWLDQHALNDPAAGIARRWNKQAKVLRRALGRVRGFDVHLGSLRQLRGILTTDSGYEPRSCRAALRQIDELERRFKRKRKDAAKLLVAALAARHDRLQRAMSDLASAPPFQQSPLPALDVRRLSEMLVAAIAAFPGFNPDSLHDLRKRLKSVRYLAELNAGSREAIDLTAAVKAMQSAIGAWHDWEELAAEAARAVRRKSEVRTLNDLLETLAKESLEKALALCESARDRFVPATPPSTALPAKLSVQRAESPSVRTQSISA